MVEVLVLSNRSRKKDGMTRDIHYQHVIPPAGRREFLLRVVRQAALEVPPTIVNLGLN